MNSKLTQVFKTLLKSYGRQGWWPIVNEKTGISEYHRKAPKDRNEVFEICVGAILTQGTQWYPNVVRAIQQLKLGRIFTKNELEVLREAEIRNKKISGKDKIITKDDILTQNTSWKNVEKALINLYPVSAEKIIALSDDELKKAIKSAGYFNQKAVYLKIFADFFLRLNKIPSRDELLSVKGIGNETADSILLYAYNKAEFVVDLYTKRLFDRLGMIKSKFYLEIKDFFESNLKKDANLFQEFHALIVEHSKRFCKKVPECNACPLRKFCDFSE
jgi:endonuclease III related protein